MRRLTRHGSPLRVLRWLFFNLLFEPIIAGILLCIWRWQQGRLLVTKILGLRVNWERIGIVQALSTLCLPIQEQEQLLLDANRLECQ